MASKLFAILLTLLPLAAVAFCPQISLPTLNRPSSFHRGVARNRPSILFAFNENKESEAGSIRFPGQQDQRDEAERVFDLTIKEGSLTLQELEQQQQMEAQQLQEYLNKKVEVAMKLAEAQLLEVYDKEANSILDNMKREREIIREEAANIIRLKDQMDSGGLWWKTTTNKTAKKGSSLALTIATFLAWTFGFSALNDLWMSYSSAGGLSSMPFVTALKIVFEVVFSILSAVIVLRRPK